MINVNPERLKEVLDIFRKYNLDKNIVLIGSWCELFYETILDEFTANVMTTDIDIYYHENKIPKVKVDFIKEMRKLGFVLEQRPHPEKTKFLSGSLEVEFLTKTTRDMNCTEKIESLDVYAECLKECEMFGSSHNTILCQNKEYGLEVRAPTPVAYVMHKILINNDRRPEKQVKDAKSIYGLLPFIENSEEYMKDWDRIYNNFSKKEKRRFNQNLQSLHLDRLLK